MALRVEEWMLADNRILETGFSFADAVPELVRLLRSEAKVL